MTFQSARYFLPDGSDPAGMWSVERLLECLINGQCYARDAKYANCGA